MHHRPTNSQTRLLFEGKRLFTTAPFTSFHLFTPFFLFFFDLTPFHVRHFARSNPSSASHNWIIIVIYKLIKISILIMLKCNSIKIVTANMMATINFLNTKTLTIIDISIIITTIIITITIIRFTLPEYPSSLHHLFQRIIQELARILCYAETLVIALKFFFIKFFNIKIK